MAQFIENVDLAAVQPLSTDERMLQLGEQIAERRPEVDLYLVAQVTIEQLAGTLTCRFRRIQPEPSRVRRPAGVLVSSTRTKPLRVTHLPRAQSFRRGAYRAPDKFASPWARSAAEALPLRAADRRPQSEARRKPKQAAPPGASAYLGL
jgi:hypothetical protein